MTGTVWALHSAARSGDLDLVVSMLAAGADVNAQSWNDNTPMHDATEAGRGAVVRALLEARASTEVPNELGFTPLHMAASLGYTEIAHQLLQADADPRALDGDGNTPLQVAREHSSGAAVHLLRNWVHDKRGTALAMALHPRLGVDSPANMLEAEMLRLVLEHVDSGVRNGSLH